MSAVLDGGEGQRHRVSFDVLNLQKLWDGWDVREFPKLKAPT